MNPRRKRPPGPSSRDLGLEAPASAGKGDTPRSCFSNDFKENFSGIGGFGNASGFTPRKNGRQVKVYGAEKPKAQDAEPTQQQTESPPPRVTRGVSWPDRDMEEHLYTKAEIYMEREGAYREALQAAANLVLTKNVPEEYGYSAPSCDAAFLAVCIQKLKNPYAH